jgi:Tol biopolymer transport system component
LAYAFVTPIVAMILGVQMHGGMVMFHYPRWSPDGRWLVLTTNVDGGADEEVWIVSKDGATRRRLTSNDAGDTAADWAPDGRSIIFERQTPAGVKSLVMDLDGANVRDYVPDSQRLKQLRLMAGDLVVEERATSDGQAVYVRDSNGNRRIGNARWSEQPAISPDGRYVVFEEREDPHDILASNIVLWDSKTNVSKIVSRGTDPSWSPDGNMLMFKVPGAKDELQIVTFDVSTRGTRVVSAGVHPQFSPDGTEVVFMTNDPNRTDVYIVRVDGSAKRCLTCGWQSSAREAAPRR